MKRHFLSALVASVAFGSLAHADPTLSIGSDTTGPGGTATVDLDISGLGNGTALGAFDVTVGFNSSIVAFNSATFGDPVLGDQLNQEGFGTVSGTSLSPGNAELYEISLDSPSALTSSQPASFTMATLTFNAISSGASSLILSVNAVADQFGNAISPSLSNGSITVSSGTTVSAPEMDPASAGSGLALLFGSLAVMRGRCTRQGRA